MQDDDEALCEYVWRFVQAIHEAKDKKMTKSIANQLAKLSTREPPYSHPNG